MPLSARALPTSSKVRYDERSPAISTHILPPRPTTQSRPPGELPREAPFPWGRPASPALLHLYVAHTAPDAQPGGHFPGWPTVISARAPTSTYRHWDETDGPCLALFPSSRHGPPFRPAQTLCPSVSSCKPQARRSPATARWAQQRSDLRRGQLLWFSYAYSTLKMHGLVAKGEQL